MGRWRLKRKFWLDASAFAPVMETTVGFEDVLFK
jgi:hypothetical protein